MKQKRRNKRENISILRDTETKPRPIVLNFSCVNSGMKAYLLIWFSCCITLQFNSAFSLLMKLS